MIRGREVTKRRRGTQKSQTLMKNRRRGSLVGYHLAWY